jgi:spore coat protein X
MSHWKYESKKSSKNCKRCNYNRWEQEVCNMEKNYWHDRGHDDATVLQDGGQFSFVNQESDELIWIKDSCNVTVQSTDTQAAVSLQVGLQLAIALVISIAIGDTIQGQAVSQEIFQQFNDEQTNKQKIYVYNSKDVNIVTTDTDLAVNIEAMLQILVALVVKLDVL